jgi:predicted  nucleic acid-binding Zn-ribbon protein
MTDADDTPTSSDASGADDAEPTVPQLLLALQAVDTDADQLAHRRANSEVREQFATASADAERWERRRDELQRRIAELGATIESAEQRGAELLTHRQRLDQQLKTVIAPREAEALMQEIATIESQRDELDIAELEALEEQSSCDDELAAHLAAEATVRDAAGRAGDAFTSELAEIDAELARLDARRTELRAVLAESLLATYDRKRDALGVAVAPLVGKQCQGCHLELSAAEIDTVKDEAAATGVTDCPDCGRLLIV